MPSEVVRKLYSWKSGRGQAEMCVPKDSRMIMKADAMCVYGPLTI